MTNYLVTGGAGFIGSNFVDYVLSNTDAQVITLDKLTYSGNIAHLALAQENPRHKFVHGDINDKTLVGQVIKDSDIIVHFAAETHVTRSEQEATLFHVANFNGTRTLLKHARTVGIHKFIHISTDEVYGSTPDKFFKEEDKLPGDSQATSNYAKSKSLADDLALSYAQLYDVPVIVARPTNNFGPRQHPEKALPRWITRLIRGQRIPVWGDGRNVRDWLYVEDTCKAILTLIEKGVPGTAYNIAANNNPEIRNIDLARMLVQSMALSQDRIQMVPDPRPNHDLRYGVNPSKVRALGWNPSKPFKDRLKETINWYVLNTAAWQTQIVEAERIYNDIK